MWRWSWPGNPLLVLRPEELRLRNAWMDRRTCTWDECQRSSRRTWDVALPIHRKVGILHLPLQNLAHPQSISQRQQCSAARRSPRLRGAAPVSVRLDTVLAKATNACPVVDGPSPPTGMSEFAKTSHVHRGFALSRSLQPIAGQANALTSNGGGVVCDARSREALAQKPTTPRHPYSQAGHA